MAYELRQLRRFKAVYNNDNSGNLLKISIVRDGVPLVCADVAEAVTATIYTPDGGTAIETATALTPTLGNSVYTLAIDTSAFPALYTIRTGYRADLTITISAAVYTGHIIFDVVKDLLALALTFDQLQDRDPRLRGRDHAGDDDFNALIEACRDEFQLRIEGMAYDYGRILEDMAIDSSKLSVVFRLYVLEAVFRAISEDWAKDAADSYEKKFEEAWRLWANQFKADTSQSGVESSEPIKQIFQRLRT